ncbi:MAG: histidinol-phosphate transaminase [Syntrophobacteraceae bacterium]
MTGFERKNIQKMTGYAPGEQPDSLDVVKLNTNENPYPPTDAVMEALHGIDPEILRRYPPPTARQFREVAAEVHGVNSENIVAVNGGDELLRLALTTFVDPHQVIGIAEPSYGLYRVLADIHDCSVLSLPLEDDWSIPQNFSRRMNDAGVKLAIITNPHAPSGYLVEVEQLARLAEELKGVLLIDEAYVNFIEPEKGYDSVGLIKIYSNILFLRTFSKGYSLAGLRFGYGIGSRSIIDPIMQKTKDSYNVDAIAQKLAIAALKSRDAAAATWLAIRLERKRLREKLEELGLICPPSQSNFLLASVPDDVGGGAFKLYESLKRDSIFVRYFDQDRLRDKIRITVGTPKENDRLIEALHRLITVR